MSGEGKAIRVLFIEDNPDDVMLEVAELRQGGLAVRHQVVETAPDARSALTRDAWDIVICDYWMPELDGFEALRIAKEVAPDTPFILVSGTAGEEIAVEAMRAGAQDYVLKDNLTRLASAVHRELREAEARRAGVVSSNGVRLLADAGAALARSLDDRATIREIPRLVNRDFSELCAIDLLNESGAAVRAASAHRDPETPREREGASERAFGLALARQAPVVVDDVATLTGQDAEAPFAQAARTLGLPALLSVPLTAPDRLVGAIHLARRAPFAPLEVQIIQELAARITVSIENTRLYEGAQRAVQLRDEFLSIASHELRTPLTALQLQIQGLRNLVRKQNPQSTDDRLPIRLDRSAHTLEKLAQLIDGLLDVSRISTGRLKLDLERFDLVPVVNEVLERFGEEARRAGCELRLVASGAVVGVWDRPRLEQVVTNLLSNAIKYGAAQPIEVELTANGDDAVVKVSDRGIGIPPADLDRIFGRFERAVSSRNYGGLGLGLYITRRIVEAHGGTVRAQPTPNGGATFTVVLPRALSTATPAAEERGRIEPAGSRAVSRSTAATPPFNFVEFVKDYAIFMLDREGRVLTWNEGARLIKGYPAQEIIGRSFATFFTDEDRARGVPESLLGRAAADGRIEVEAWRVRKDGGRFWADVVITALFDEDGSLRGFAKVTRDLTERHRNEELLRASEERLRLLIESVKDYAIFMLDPQGRIDTWNAGAGRITRYQVAEVLGQPFSLLYPPEDVAAGRPQRELEIAAAEGRYEEEGWRVRKGGERFWASVVLTAIHDPITRQLRGFAKVTRDLTERRRIEQHVQAATQEAGRERARALEAQGALQMRDEFISVAAHELRTPLTALQLKLQSASRALDVTKAPPTGDQLAKVGGRLAGALRQVERLSELVERLLDVSRIVQGQLVMQAEQADLGAIVRRVVDDFRELAAGAGSDLRFQCPTAVLGSWDTARIEQVLMNLLANAIKYGGGKPIDVRVEADGVAARVAVVDRGIGISREDLDRVFTRFERAAPLRHYGGLGLGLYVTRNIVEAHGGTIRVSSAPEQGATFVVELPRHGLAPQGAGAVPPEPRPDL